MEQIKKRIKTLTKHGGSWFHLKKELVQIGFIEDLAEAFVSRFGNDGSILGDENSEKALKVFDFWVKERKRGRDGHSTLLLLDMRVY